jgi:Xaa-Pro aminopeptidase
MQCRVFAELQSVHQLQLCGSTTAMPLQQSAALTLPPALLTLLQCDTPSLRDGTTDVTRTLHFGTPTAHEKHCFTLVLKGHINLATAVFPEGLLGSKLDVLARTPLWTAGLDYRHGTVSTYTCVAYIMYEA